MVSTDQVLDEHLGMIDRQTASKMAEDKSLAQELESNDPLDIASEMISVKQMILGNVKANSLVEIEETVYRVYNKKSVDINGADILIRMIILGTQGENIRLILFGEKAEIVNSLPIERGDRIIARNFVVRRGYNGLELASIVQSTIKIEYSAKSGINEFAKIKGGASEVDVLGKMLVIGPIKHSIFAKGRDTDSCTFTISDGIDQMKVVAVGNVIRDVENSHPGDPIKIEFATVRSGISGPELYLNESSRVLVSQSLKSRLRV